MSTSSHPEGGDNSSSIDPSTLSQETRYAGDFDLSNQELDCALASQREHGSSKTVKDYAIDLENLKIDRALASLRNDETVQDPESEVEGDPGPEPSFKKRKVESASEPESSQRGNGEAK